MPRDGVRLWKHGDAYFPVGAGEPTCVAYPHPAATAREEAWKAMVEALEFYANRDAYFPRNVGEQTYIAGAAVCDAGATATRALALARSTAGA